MERRERYRERCADSLRWTTVASRAMRGWRAVVLRGTAVRRMHSRRRRRRMRRALRAWATLAARATARLAVFAAEWRRRRPLQCAVLALGARRARAHVLRRRELAAHLAAWWALVRVGAFERPLAHRRRAGRAAALVVWRREWRAGLARRESMVAVLHATRRRALLKLWQVRLSGQGQAQGRWPGSGSLVRLRVRVRVRVRAARPVAAVWCMRMRALAMDTLTSEVRTLAGRCVAGGERAGLRTRAA